MQALHAGYRVRCIVRREDAIAVIKSGPSVQDFLDRIEFATVSDNAIPGAYDNALIGAKYVVHIAGAWPLPVRIFASISRTKFKIVPASPSRQ